MPRRLIENTNSKPRNSTKKSLKLTRFRWLWAIGCIRDQAHKLPRNLKEGHRKLGAKSKETKQIKGRKQFDGNLRWVCTEIWGKNECWDLGANTHETFMSAGIGI